MASTSKTLFVKKTVIDPDMKKMFQEKRKARIDQIQSKIQAERQKRATSNENLTKIKPTKSISASSQKRSVSANANSQKPQIKQTKASLLRIDKNNPLLKYNREDLLKIVQSCENSNKSSQANQKPEFRTTPINTAQNRSSRVDSARNSSVTRKSIKPPLRRSISAMHVQNKAHSKVKHCVTFKGLPKAHSEENISFHNEINVPSPIIEESEPNISRTGQKAVMFLTPVQPRRSQNFCNRTPAPSELRERLLNWLKKRGKSLNAYSHLRCFGVHQSTPYRPPRRCSTRHLDDSEDENKENRAELAPVVNDDFVPKVVDYTNFTTNNDLFGTPDQTVDDKKLAQEALCDVHALILEKYPDDQCAAWLSALKRKYPHLQEQPQYWECRAALGEINGEFNEAVECYQQAIISGAEVTKIDHSIEKLLEKFSVLDLDPSTKKQDTQAKKQRSKIILDARNIFKSSVIKFAVQQRENRITRNKIEPTTPLVAKPVRRSTRLSRSVFVSTPKEKLYNSINEIDTSLGQSVSFQTNQALFEQ